MKWVYYNCLNLHELCFQSYGSLRLCVSSRSMQQAWEERHVTLSLVSVSRHISDIIIDIIIDCVHKPPQANI